MESNKLERQRTMQDSGLGSFGSESDTSPVTSAATHPLLAVQAGTQYSTKPPDSNMSSRPGLGRRFRVTYLGETVLDRRYTQTMLPWIIAEVRQRGQKQLIELEVLTETLQGRVAEAGEMRVLFEHRLQTLSRFARTHQDLKCFVYFTRPNVESPFKCHVFNTAEESLVPHLFTAIREATKEIQLQNPSNNGGESHVQGHEPMHVARSHLCEVMYVGKVLVSNKKAPPTFIDEAVAKFQDQMETRRLEASREADRQRHNSDDSVRSLPADLTIVTDIHENQLASQTPRAGSHCSAGSQGSLGLVEDSLNRNAKSPTDFEDNIPLGGSSSSLTQNITPTACARSHVDIFSTSPSMTSSIPEQLISPSQDSIHNLFLHGDGTGSHHHGDHENLQKTVFQGQVRRNRTMLLQVGISEICLISPDRKRVIFERKFKDISFCSQGIQHPEHFGFISRDPTANRFMCYVFRCANEPLVEEVMQTLKRAFETAFQTTTPTTKGHVVCELCPMHQLHKLCLQIEKLPADQVYDVLRRRVGQLNEKDQMDIWNRVEEQRPVNVQDRNELVMCILHQMSEEKQQQHIHISDSNRNQYRADFVLSDCPQTKSSPTIESVLDNFTSKAKKSLASSFDSILRPSRPKKEDVPSAFQDRTWPTESNSRDSSFSRSFDSMGDTSEGTPLSSPLAREYCSQMPTPWGKAFGDSTPTPPMKIHQRRRTGSEIPNLPHDIGGTSGVELIGTPPSESPLRTMFLNSRLSPQTPISQGCCHGNTTPYTPHSRGSWRRDILNRVVTPGRNKQHWAPGERLSQSDGAVMLRKRLTPHKIRELWRKAILETLLLIRMEKENHSIQEKREKELTKSRQDEVEQKRLKLDYEEITPCLKEVTKVWDQLLESAERRNTKCDISILSNAVKDGVPRTRRGAVWQLLCEQYQLHYLCGACSPLDAATDLNTDYQDLLRQLTTHQHQILLDLGRTFPTHPYFSTQLGPGQLSLFNLLKAYSLLDNEVGYCQGLSFVAGILLMHMKEEKAFEAMKFLMFQQGFRHQYCPDMVTLQIQLYQLSRLLHDYYRDLYDHLEFHDIAPTLYAAPWFLTIFASQFPLGFVARVLDLIYLQGLEVVFKVSLVLLGNHRELIKQCDSFETIMEFLKTTLPEMGIIQMERVINQVFQLDLTQQLQAYEVEYHVLQEELIAAAPRTSANPADPAAPQPDPVLDQLEQSNLNLQRQNHELREQLQNSHSQCTTLDNQVHELQSGRQKMQSHIRTLELERAALLNAVAKLRHILPNDSQQGKVGLNLVTPPPESTESIKITNSPIHNPLVDRFLQDLDVRLTSPSLAEVDREVAALMARGKRASATSLMGEPNGNTGDSDCDNFLTVVDVHRGRPASSNY